MELAPVTACITSVATKSRRRRAFARPPERALDNIAQCCGVCLPVPMQASSASMSCHRIRSAAPLRGRRLAVVNRGDERRKSAAPYSGAKELPIAIGRLDAMLFHVGAGQGASVIRRAAGPGAGSTALTALTALTPCLHCWHSVRQG